MAAPSLPGVDWNEVKTLSLAIGCREAARRMGINEDTVMARSAREGWFAERDKAKQALTEDHRKQLVAIATNATIEQVEAIPTADKVIASNASKSRAVAGNVALRALERLERCDDDELIMPSVADVALKYTGMAGKAGGWDAQERSGSQQTVVNICFLGPQQDSPVVDV